MGEANHLACAREVLARDDCPAQERVRWQEIRIPPRALGGWRRLRSERVWCRQVFGVAKHPQVRVLVICSITETGLLVLKGMLHTHRIPVAVLAMLHSVLASVERPQPQRPWNWATSLRQVLRLPQPRELTYLVLGPSIRASLAEGLPHVASHFEVMDPPYVMPPIPSSCAVEGTMRFGHFGTATYVKGFDKFLRLAQEVREHRPKHQSEFVMVGFVANGGERIANQGSSVRDIPYIPLRPEEYCDRARQVTYAVSITDPSHYRLAASASFLDALRYLKPGIYLRNRYLEYYFSKLGDLGYLCDSYEEIREVVFSILEQFPEARYRQQCENIQRGRRMFEPGIIAPQLRAIVTGRERVLGKPQGDGAWPMR
jgi:hypothetical protein